MRRNPRLPFFFFCFVFLKKRKKSVYMVYMILGYCRTAEVMVYGDQYHWRNRNEYATDPL